MNLNNVEGLGEVEISAQYTNCDLSEWIAIKELTIGVSTSVASC